MCISNMLLKNKKVDIGMLINTPFLASLLNLPIKTDGIRYIFL